MPIIDKWALVHVGLGMLRDCTDSNVWESSFIAVNMHPLHRIPFEDWMQKISPFVKAAEKFEDEVIDLTELLPKSWVQLPLHQRQSWLDMIKKDGESWDVDLISKLRASGMQLCHLSNIFKLYHAEKRIADSLNETQLPLTPATPNRPKAKSKARAKGRMIYHLWNAGCDGDMSKEERFQHAVTVRNRHYGPEATCVSPHLDVAMTEDNKRFLKLNKDDLNMYKVLQQSTVKHGDRRKVAKRALSILGRATGQSRIVNGPKELVEIKAGLQFAASLEEMRAAEKSFKKAKALAKKQRQEAAKRKRVANEAKIKAKYDKIFENVKTKLGIGADDEVCQRHISTLTRDQLKSVALCQCGMRTLRGRLDEMRETLKEHLPTIPAEVVPEDEERLEYATQDEVYDDSGSTTTATEVIEFKELQHYPEGLGVEVFWSGENKWYTGKLMGVDSDERQFYIHYEDGAKLWHNEQDYPVRY